MALTPGMVNDLPKRRVVSKVIAVKPMVGKDTTRDRWGVVGVVLVAAISMDEEGTTTE